jgi:hypothetical protein
VLPQCRQGLLRRLPQLAIVTRSLFLLEEANRLDVVRDHVAHVLVVEGLPSRV